MTVLAGVPLKGFELAKGRLATSMGPAVRERLAQETAHRVVRAAAGAGLDVVVVTSSPRVREWAHRQGVTTFDEPAGAGLDAAAAIIAAQGAPWCVIHADLPLLAPSDLEIIPLMLSKGRAVLAPSRDGGTNVFAAPRPVSFAYGVGSFARHLATVGTLEPHIVVRPGLCVEIDTIADVEAAARMPGGGWLADYLR